MCDVDDSSFFLIIHIDCKLIKKTVKPAGKWRKCLTLHYVKINAIYLIYTSYIAITQISTFFNRYNFLNNHIVNEN